MIGFDQFVAMASKAERASLSSVEPAAPDLSFHDFQQPTVSDAIAATQTHRTERRFSAFADQGRVAALLKHRRLSADRATERCIVGEYRGCVMLQVSVIEEPRRRERGEQERVDCPLRQSTREDVQPSGVG
jgi:hypothetical protein